MHNSFKKIALKDTKSYDKEGFSVDEYLPTEENYGFNILRVRVAEKHDKTTVINGARSYFVLDGNGRFDINGVETNVQLNDLLVISGGTEYQYKGKMTLLEFNTGIKQNKIY